jgi:hypothetical protein
MFCFSIAIGDPVFKRYSFIVTYPLVNVYIAIENGPFIQDARQCTAQANFTTEIQSEVRDSFISTDVACSFKLFLPYGFFHTSCQIKWSCEEKQIFDLCEFTQHSLDCCGAMSLSRTPSWEPQWGRRIGNHLDLVWVEFLVSPKWTWSWTG